MNEPHPNRPRHIRLQSWQDLSPNLRRLVFHSESLADYPYTCNGAHIKLLFPKQPGSLPELPAYTPQGVKWADNADKPYSRAYTLRRFDRAARTLTVDFVLHGDNGPASAFAGQPRIGHPLGLSVPGGPNPMLKPAAAYLMAGDLTALPAVSAMAEDMPPHARGHILLWLPDPADLPDLPLPEHLHLHPFFGPPGHPDTLARLADTFTRLRPPADSRIWIAGEAEMVGRLRHTARIDWQTPLAACYATPYWRRGENEEQYHRKRHDFMDNDPSAGLNATQS